MLLVSFSFILAKVIRSWLPIVTVSHWVIRSGTSWFWCDWGLQTDSRGRSDDWWRVSEQTWAMGMQHWIIILLTPVLPLIDLIAIKNQRKARNALNRGLWVPWAVSLWVKESWIDLICACPPSNVIGWISDLYRAPPWLQGRQSNSSCGSWKEKPGSYLVSPELWDGHTFHQQSSYQLLPVRNDVETEICTV